VTVAASIAYGIGAAADVLGLVLIFLVRGERPEKSFDTLCGGPADRAGGADVTV
jgi:hypothetical protein